MMTFSEARSRAAVNRARIVRTIYGNDRRLGLHIGSGVFEGESW